MSIRKYPCKRAMKQHRSFAKTPLEVEEDKKMRIILDGMGGDHAPASVVEGAILAMKRDGARNRHCRSAGGLIEAELKNINMIISGCRWWTPERHHQR